jgi:copper oxidase (laccase) domain-containing protein
VGLASFEGTIGAAHVGWRGLVAGVLVGTVQQMRALGASEVVAVLGPCIHAECYEFGSSELQAVAAVLGDEVRAETSSGRPALDLPFGVRRALAEIDVPVLAELGGCTACDTQWFSFRARRDTSRHALAIWRDSSGPVRDRDG